MRGDTSDKKHGPEKLRKEEVRRWRETRNGGKEERKTRK